MFLIQTLPVYSRIADHNAFDEPRLAIRLPTDANGKRWQVSTHQVETYRAIASAEYDVVINTSMTGDGKSLAAYMHPFIENKPFLAMYPTNELARDQQISLPKLQKSFDGKLGKPERVSAETLDQLAQQYNSTKRDELDRILTNARIVLTNPDIFHYLAQFFYTQPKGETPERRFIRRVMGGFDQFVFDEFHIFQAPQVVAILNALLLMRATQRQNRRKTFVFLSATPDDLLIDYLKRAGFRYQLIRGEYNHSRESFDPEQWRLIIRESAIAFVPTSAEFRAEQWVRENVQQIVDYFADGVAKGAIIVNSVATAYRIKAFLDDALARHNIVAELNTGLSSADTREVSRSADLLIGTSTVDVGVDFKINFLIFESLDAGSFMQRLGRLGRHDTDERGRTFDRFKAIALLPTFIVERLFVGYRGEDALLSAETDITREQLNDAILAAFPRHATFERYAKEWGWVQSVRVYSQLHAYPIKGAYKQSLTQLKEDYWNTFGISIGRQWQRYIDLLKEQKPLVEEAQSFRGGSPLQCGITDKTDGDRVKVYNLSSLVANGKLRWLGKARFLEFAGDDLPPRHERLLGWFAFFGFEEERRDVSIEVEGDLAGWSAEKFGQPILSKNLTFAVNPAPEWLADLNSYMRRRQFVVNFCRVHPAELRRRLSLPPLFGLFAYADTFGNTGAVALARNALLLHVALYGRSLDVSDDPIFC